MAKLGKKLDKVNKLSKRQAESCIPSPSPEPVQPCKKCGKPAWEGYEYCQKCWGATVLLEPEPAPQPSPSEPKTQSYWDTKREQINKLIKELQSKPHEFILGHFEYPESILNAYREGDVLFDDAVQELQRWSYRFVEKNKSQPEPQQLEDDTLAAYAFVEQMIRRRVDKWDSNAPMWYGWALREAFKAGIEQQRQAIAASQRECAECKAETIQQFAEKCIEGMPKVHAACTCGQAQYDACIAHIRTEKEAGK